MKHNKPLPPRPARGNLSGTSTGISISKNNRSAFMTFTKTALSILALTVIATPALAQGRWGDQAADNAARREERAAVRQLEEQYEKEVAAAKAAASAPATPADVAAAPAPAEPAAVAPAQ
jgi:hypothetical protein